MNEKDEQIKHHLSNLIQQKVDGLDFSDADTHYATHAYHNYPATMIPQLPRLFLQSIQDYQSIQKVYDPFMGSGTTLVEASLMGIDSTGVDLNPLAQLISQVETKKLDPTKLQRSWDALKQKIAKDRDKYNRGELTVHFLEFPRIDYWFQPYVRIDLQIIKQNIQDVSDMTFRQFFSIAFSMTARDVSNTRNGEFKMYRMAKGKLADWHPDVFSHFQDIVNKNLERNAHTPKMPGIAKPYLGNANHVSQLDDDSCDLLITSPPYGDSKTTVAYGQFSRTSLQWLNLDCLRTNQVTRLDNRLLGGKVTTKDIPTTPSKTLNYRLRLISDIDYKRACQVTQFYSDLYRTLKESKRIMKKGSYQFWVTSNRTVKGITLPTDKIIIELYQSLHIEEIAELHRHISHKRMPSQNSPHNRKGSTARTMRVEDILLFKTTKNG